ncbi:MFS family permease [Actinomadura viridis]|uniref:MFS family permease n=1 Tax=Actinomadura viridis TaxID=58110 RepID=A0A931DQ41_9ACTN|nr:MFS family permease [Actinomadura viridis]
MKGTGPQGDAPYGWKPLVVLATVGIIDRFEQQLLPGVLPFIQEEWGFSDTAAGMLPLGSALAAVLISPLAGYLADRYRRTTIITVVVLCWALATLFSSLATGLVVFFLIRMFLAASEGFYGPVSGSLLADFYPPASRPKAYGWKGLAPYLGGLGTVVGGVLAQHFGWRAAFVIAAVPGLVVAAICWRLKEPPRGLLDRLAAGLPAEAAPAEGGAPHPRPDFRRQIRQVPTIPTIALLSLALSAVGFGLAGIFYWLPTLIHRDYGVREGAAASVSGLVTVTGVMIGVLTGTWLGRRWHERRKAGRLLVGGGGIAIGGTGLALAVSMPVLGGLAALLLISVAFMAMAIPNLTASIADVLDASSRGVGFALVQLLGTAGLAFGPFVVGMISDRTGSMATAMYVPTVPLLLGGALTITARLTFDRDRIRALGR